MIDNMWYDDVCMWYISVILSLYELHCVMMIITSTNNIIIFIFNCYSIKFKFSIWFLSLGASKEQISSLYHLHHSDIDVDFVKDVFDETELLCLELTKQMTLDIIQVDKDLKLNIQKLLGSTAFVELVTVISAYNMVSRFLVALDIPIETDTLPTTIEVGIDDSKIGNDAVKD